MAGYDYQSCGRENVLMRGVVFDIARFSLHDGPGIRTVVFLKGCPLRCRWCHNPEGWQMQPEIFFDETKCVFCGKCAGVCQNHQVQNFQHSFARQRCIGCGACAEHCPTGALQLVGSRMSPDEVMAEVMKDFAYYGKTGGITLSGGEPLLQIDFSTEILKQAGEKGISTAIETCGFASAETIRRAIPLVNLWLFDLKAADREKHIKLTGQDNESILKNLFLLDQAGVNIELRCPLIPGVNDSLEDLLGILNIVKRLKSPFTITPEPYHPFGLDKRKKLGLNELPPYPVPEESDLRRWQEILLPQT